METIVLEIAREDSGSVASQQNVIFDKVLIQKGDIVYNTQTGEITINKLGRYYVNWSVATQSALGAPDVTFSIISSRGHNIPGSTPLKIGQIIGFGVIQADSVPIILRLVNKETADIYYSSTAELNAHLVVSELLENTEGKIGPTGPPGPAGETGPTGPRGPQGGWESAGVQLINTQPAAGAQITIAEGEPIAFDHVAVQFNGVSYANNKIQISEEGYYLISWSFIARAIQEGQHVIAYLEEATAASTDSQSWLSQLSSIYSQRVNAYPIKVYGKSGSTAIGFSPITGTALISVVGLTFPYSLDLQIINRSNSTIEMTSAHNTEGDLSIHFAGSLTVIKIGDIYWS